MTETVTTSDTVLYEVQDRVAVLTLNRPERLNAWNDELGTAYFDALDRAGADSDIRVIVVTGAGRGWCAGADMNVLEAISESHDDDDRPASDRRNATHATTIPKPVIAAINGACAGLGFAHAMACDLRFAAAGAKFTTAFSRRGLIAEHGTSWTVPHLAGQAVALDVLLSGRLFFAEEAERMGLVNRVFPPDALMPETMEYARDLATNVSPASMAVMKRQIYGHPALPLREAVAESNHLMRESFDRPDFAEGVASYLEKREPDFPPLLDLG